MCLFLGWCIDYSTALPSMSTEALKRQIFGARNWIVLGDVLAPSKPAYRIRAKLVDNGYNVACVNPRITPTTSGPACYRTFAEVGATGTKPDVLDLCINPATGRELIKEALTLGVRYILIQPGAADESLIALLDELQVHYVRGCVLVDMPHGGYTAALTTLAATIDAETKEHPELEIYAHDRRPTSYDTTYIQLDLDHMLPLRVGSDDDQVSYTFATENFTHQFEQHRYYLNQAVIRTRRHIVLGLKCKWFHSPVVCIYIHP